MKQLSREQCMEYLSDVANIETMVYVWANALEAENAKMREINSEKHKALAVMNESESRIKDIDTKYRQAEEKNQRG